jgi:predicted membrane-bound mannosyltransferase/DNA-binding beta-propeller fold protein YncE
VTPAAVARPGLLQRTLARRIPISLEVGLYALVFAAALGIRIWDLGSQALHHDESIHAQWSWALLQGNYHHSPIFHGPLYYHIQAAFFLVFGANDYTARLSPAIIGTVLVALPLLLRSRLGPVGTFAAVALLAASPTLVYYSRFFREDIFMAAFTLVMVAAMWRYIDEGRVRWLYVFAGGFTANVLTKEGSLLVFAAMLVYLNLFVATLLARRTLEARTERFIREDLDRIAALPVSPAERAALEDAVRSNGKLDTPLRRFALTLAFAPYAWVMAALWPLVGSLRRRLDWGQELPRPAGVLVLLGTFCLPLLTPVTRVWLLEPLGIIEQDRLYWERSLQGPISLGDGLLLLGLFTVTTSIAAFAGLLWRPKVWGIAFALSALVFLTLMTSLWTNLHGLISGPWGSLDYWYGQQDAHRGEQPWFYYYMLMFAYEYLPLALIALGGWWAVVKGDPFSRFLVFWLAGVWLALSWGAEKMPWLNAHIALPACILAAWSLQRAWDAWRERPPVSSRVVLGLVAAAAIAFGALLVIAYLPGGAAMNGLRLALFLVAAGFVALIARGFGRRAWPAVVAIAIIGALAPFSIRTMVQASYERGDVPKDLLIYTQTSPYVKDIRDQISALAEATGLGYDLPIAVDTTDAFAWPWAWYLRDYRNVAYLDLSTGQPPGQYQVMLVAVGNLGRIQEYLARPDTTVFAPPVRYPHRWWFEEIYKTAMAVEPGHPCTSRNGTCSPYRPATWKHIITGITDRGWLQAWALYWRDHDPRRPPGSTDAFALLPANFDPATGRLRTEPVAPPGPTQDGEGRPVFGGAGPRPGEFFAPIDIERDAAGNLYVIDSATNRLQKFDSAGNFLQAVDIRLDPQSRAEESEPWGLALGPNGEVIVADTFGWRVRVFDANLQPLVTFGQAPAGPVPGPFDLFGPRDAVVAGDGTLWVTDTGHDRIQVYTLTGEFVRTIGRSGSGPGEFDEPVGLALGPDGTIYVADMYNRRVQVLGPDGSYLREFPVEGWGGQDVTDKPYLRVLADGRVAVGVPSGDVVRIYSPDGQPVAVIRPEREPLSRPYGMAETPDGKLWIVEGGAARVRLFTVPD